MLKKITILENVKSNTKTPRDILKKLKTSIKNIATGFYVTRVIMILFNSKIFVVYT